jgi:hypothetical protein
MYSCISALIQWMADGAFLDEVGVRQAVAEVAARDRHHQPQVGHHELARGIEVVFRPKPVRERALFVGGQDRKAIDRLHIRLEAPGGHGHGDRNRQGRRRLHGLISS